MRAAIGGLSLVVWLGLVGCPEDPKPADPDGTTGSDTSVNETGGSDSVSSDEGSTPDTPSTDAAGDTVEPAATCELYCSLVQTVCTGDNAQYDNETQCLTICKEWAAWDVGDADDTDGNTITCRLYHANAASSSDANAAETHCPHAGPSGGGVCGTWCDNYCDLATKNCSGAAELYASEAQCQATCAGFAESGPLDASTGNTVQCRIYHLSVAGSDPPDSAALHCPHGSEDGGGVCVDPDPTCENYCGEVTSACTGDNAQYASEQACLDYCNTHGKIPAGTAGDQSGNSIACRIYHAGVAGGGDAQAAIHCDHAGPSGGDVCGSWCTNYCHLAQTNCTGTDELFTNDDTCTTACALYDESGSTGDVDGDTVQCRIYHLGVAGDSGAGGAATHCPHGGTDGGNVCVNPPPSCSLYCDRVMSACTDSNAQYADSAACLAHCETYAGWDLGASIDETSGNTVGCRIYHATVAASENPELHCPHAGPSGGDVCGSWCTNYCALAGKNCTGGDELFSNVDDCTTACAGFAETGAANDVDGDTVQCRIYHLGVAGNSDAGGASTHCPHGSSDGGGVCVAPVAEPGDCASYCTSVTANCTGDNAQYASESECLTYCNTTAALPAGLTTDTTGNTVGCRIYHADAASSDPGLHCAHAGPTGGNLCGTWCENYCYLSDKFCTGGEAIDFGSDDCATACAAYADTGSVGDTGGDTVQCRLYHLGVAAGDAVTHCPHAAPDGGNVCVDAEPTPATYTDDAQPIFAAKCAGCHTGGGSGSHNIGSNYADASKNANNSDCTGLTVGECTIVRIQSGEMPFGAGCSGDPALDAGKSNCLTQAEQDTIQAWIDGGLLEN